MYLLRKVPIPWVREKVLSALSGLAEPRVRTGLELSPSCLSPVIVAFAFGVYRWVFAGYRRVAEHGPSGAADRLLPYSDLRERLQRAFSYPRTSPGSGITMPLCFLKMCLNHCMRSGTSR